MPSPFLRPFLAWRPSPALLATTLSAALLSSAAVGFVTGSRQAAPVDALDPVASVGAGATLPLRSVQAPTTIATAPPQAAPPSTAAQLDAELAAWLAEAPAVAAGTGAAGFADLSQRAVTAPRPTVTSAGYHGWHHLGGRHHAGGGRTGGVTGGTTTGGSPTGSTGTTGGSTGGTPAPTPTPIPPPTPGRTAAFGLMTFNVLGASHTTRGERGFRTGAARVPGVVSLLTRHGADVVGFQELEPVQGRAFVSRTGGAYGLYPGPSSRWSANSIAWRKDRWSLVRSTTVTVPYFDGRSSQQPVVLLRDKTTGMSMYFANFHNPADTRAHPRQQKWRLQATTAEIAMARRIHATGLPLFVTGDMNERAAYFCRLTAGASFLRAAKGGSNGSGGCTPHQATNIDWIFGTSGARFSGYTEDRSALVRRTTDHPVMTAHVTVASRTFPKTLP